MRAIIKMVKNINAFVLILLFVGLIAVSFYIPSKSAPYFANPAPLSGFSSFDIAGVIMGFRRFAANIAWIQLLQYIGTPEGLNLTTEQSFIVSLRSAKLFFGVDLIDEERAKEIIMPQIARDFEGDMESHKNLLNYTYRVVRLDPSFEYAYLFSGSALAWNYDRTDEALELLREGIQNNPKLWRLHLYISAIIYKKELKHEEMLKKIEEAAKYEDAPNMIRVILANIYEKDGRYAESLKLWIEVVESRDDMHYERGLKKIEKLSAILGIPYN